ncbi:uncharacterized protein H6S33_003337 [Morchella sextelata]|uniref:uncharacterized protein n=1 Tax=Morchella sextelata TaxID=1174677 RepID=UPI001D03C3F1|nr:uncharacterized protein H6S33_003337 [Morchella sextelata]KAH0606503.1 hypothetical protein H6S33_003337 [Morchella sextelata]
MSLSSNFWSKQLEKKLESLNTPPVQKHPQAPAELEITEEDAPPVYLEHIPEMPPAYREIFIELEGALATEGALAVEGTPAAEGTQAAEGTPGPEETPAIEETPATGATPTAEGTPPADEPPESFLRFLVRLGKKMLSSVWGSIRDFLSFVRILAKKAEEEQPDPAPFDLEKEILDMCEKQKVRDAESIDEAGKALKENLKNRSPQEQRRGLTVWGKILGWVGDAWNAFRGWMGGAWNAFRGCLQQLFSGIRGMMVKVGDVFLKAWKWLSSCTGPSL